MLGQAFYVQFHSITPVCLRFPCSKVEGRSRCTGSAVRIVVSRSHSPRMLIPEAGSPGRTGGRPGHGDRGGSVAAHQLDQLDAPYAHAEDGRQNPGGSVTATAEGSPPLGGCPAGASHTGSPFCAGLCAKQEDQGQKGIPEVGKCSGRCRDSEAPGKPSEAARSCRVGWTKFPHGPGTAPELGPGLGGLQLAGR